MDVIFRFRDIGKNRFQIEAIRPDGSWATVFQGNGQNTLNEFRRLADEKDLAIFSLDFAFTCSEDYSIRFLAIRL